MCSYLLYLAFLFIGVFDKMLSMKKYENLAKTIYDIGKLSFATLILGQFVSHKFSLLVTIFGIILTGSAFFVAFKIENKEEKDQ